MKVLLISILMVFAIRSNFAQPVEYDSVMAKSLGADELGMKMYVLVILKTGSAHITDTAIRAKLFKGHFENINALAKQGKMLTAGPMDANDQQYRGIFLLNVADIEDARKLLEGDPTVAAHIFEPLFFKLYGSAALQQIPDLHRKIQKVHQE